MEALRAKAERPAAELERLRKSAFEQKLSHRRGLERAEARAEEAEARAAEARVAQEQRVSEGGREGVLRTRTAHLNYRDFLTDIDKLMPKYIGLAKSEHITNTPIV